MAERESNPLVEQIRRGGVPLDVRMMAAEGALPLKPEDLVDLLELMHRDPLAEVANLATRTFSELSVETLLPLVKARDAAVEVLAWTLEVRTDTKLLEACLQNTSTPDEAIAHQAGRLPESLAELVQQPDLLVLERDVVCREFEGDDEVRLARIDPQEAAGHHVVEERFFGIPLEGNLNVFDAVSCLC